MVYSNPLIKKDQRKKRAQKASKIMRKITPMLTVTMLVMCTLVTFASAMTEDEATFFKNAFLVLEIVIIIIGGGLALWGIVNLLEGYGNDNPGAKSQGMKQLMAGAGIILIGAVLVPALQNLFINEENRAATEGGTGASNSGTGGTAGETTYTQL